MGRLRIVLGNSSLAAYPEGGGHWSCFLQHLLGLVDLGHDVHWLEVLYSSGDSERDRRHIATFFGRMAAAGVRDRCTLLLHDQSVGRDTADLQRGQLFGADRARLQEVIATADLLWNFANALKNPLLAQFRRRVLVDLDPGVLQISAERWDMGQDSHEVFLTVGTKLHDADCKVPTIDRTWHRFVPPVYLPMWPVQPDPGPAAPFSTVTQWTWEELGPDPALSLSKRQAFLRYLPLPGRAGRGFELAANIHPDDDSGDRELLRDHDWRLVHAHEVAGSPEAYRGYIAASRAELSCPKPIFRALRTGWLSDRSACYLASGRPVLAEDTGVADHYPTGDGLVCFRHLDDALAGAAAIDADYQHHSRAARAFAEEFLDSRRSLTAMLAACAVT
jgi:hypothetical protein